ncbi:hypothetical protein CBER1_04875 [Cercospora berteroae]|uniref:Uncharacterized protein n=1 Tax=Cercospora berteroae TaxID=357750 RepID=A0A2S6BRX9_9PEZI|nr:hypothetical protein CBER1_04875 [Cercospora berteroae]
MSPPDTISVSEALHTKYELEKNKRLKESGISQYVDVRSQSLEALAKDPWVDYNDPRVRDPPLKDGDKIKYLITGAGINGVVFAGRLIEAGVGREDVVCVDIAGGFGGTWYYNRYPGVMCDVEGYCYVPFLEETGYQPRHRYSYGHEIRGQIERSVDHFGIKGQLCTSVDSQIWDEDKKLWVITLTRTVGEPSTSKTFTVHADFILHSNAPFILPKLPKLPGWDELYRTKRVFHSSRWDYDYTGGTQEKPDPVNLRGKRVAIIGIGATAVQIVPVLAKWADHVYVVQRTPSYVGARGQSRNYPREVGPNNEREGLATKAEDCLRCIPGSGFLGSNTKLVTPDNVEEHIKELYAIDIARTELLRKRVEDIVKDKSTAEKLQAWYGSWCKRPSFHDEYLQAFNKPNVTLIDTDGKGLDGYTKSGILLDGAEFEIDALILATGFTFDPALDPSEKMRTAIQGRNGLTMKDYWNQPESGTVFGVAMPGFPNMFSTFLRGSPTTWNSMHIMEMAAALFIGVVQQAQKRTREGGRIVVEASKEGERRYGEEVAKRAGWFSVLPTCTPGYFTEEGAASFQKPEQKSEEEKFNEAKRMPWGAGPVDFRDMTEGHELRGCNGLNEDMWIGLDKTKRMAQITATTAINSPYQANQSFIVPSKQQTEPPQTSSTTTPKQHSSTALMKSPNRADTFGSDTTAFSTSSKFTWNSTTSSQTQSNANKKNKTYKPKKPKAQTVQFSDVGRHSNQWLFNDMSISDAVKTLFGKK